VDLAVEREKRSATERGVEIAQASANLSERQIAQSGRQASRGASVGAPAEEELRGLNDCVNSETAAQVIFEAHVSEWGSAGRKCAALVQTEVQLSGDELTRKQRSNEVERQAQQVAKGEIQREVNARQEIGERERGSEVQERVAATNTDLHAQIEASVEQIRQDLKNFQIGDGSCGLDARRGWLNGHRDGYVDRRCNGGLDGGCNGCLDRNVDRRSNGGLDGGLNGHTIFRARSSGNKSIIAFAAAATNTAVTFFVTNDSIVTASRFAQLRDRESRSPAGQTQAVI
jgi:hypothetical protein